MEDPETPNSMPAEFPAVWNGSDSSTGEVMCHNYYNVASTVVLSALMGLVCVVTITGNTLVVIAFAVDRKLRSFGNYFILNLALSDLVVGLLIGIYAPYLLRGCWQLTRPGCLSFLLLDYVVPLASAWNMALISLDRYWSVARPIEYRLKMNTNVAVLCMTVPWLAGTVWYGPSVLLWETLSGRQAVPDGKCFVDFYANVGYLIACSCVEFVLPFVTVATINVLIYLNIRRRSRGLMMASSLATTSSVTGADDSQTTAKAKKLLSRDKKSARSLAILIVVFLFTWAPYEICAFVHPVCNFCIPNFTLEVVFWLLWLNSTINPMLYPFLQQRFRVTFVRLLTCTCRSPAAESSLQSTRDDRTTCPMTRLTRNDPPR